MRRSTVLILVLTAVLPVIVLAATNSDQEFRDCLREATNRREDRIVDTTRNYYNDLQGLLEEHRSRTLDAFGIEVDRDRDNEIREVDKDIRNRIRERDRNQQNDLRNITNDFRNDDKNCRNDLRNRDNERRKVRVGQQCRSSDECNSPFGACTTEFGDCRHFCGENDDCQNECQGNCVLR